MQLESDGLGWKEWLEVKVEWVVVCFLDSHWIYSSLRIPMSCCEFRCLFGSPAVKDRGPPTYASMKASQDGSSEEDMIILKRRSEILKSLSPRRLSFS
jgi:hypothetical protein